MTVQSVKERELPALDDDFAQLASEFDTLDELRDDLRQQVAQTKKVEQGCRRATACSSALLETVDVPLPEGIVDDEVHRHLDGRGPAAGRRAPRRGRRRGPQGLQAQLLLDAVAEKVQVQVNQNELIDHIVASAQQYGMDPNPFAKAVDAGRPGAGDGRRGRPPQGARRGAREGRRHGRVGNPVDLAELFKAEDGDEEPLEGTAEEGAAAEQAARPECRGSRGLRPTALPTIAVADFEPDDAKAEPPPTRSPRTAHPAGAPSVAQARHGEWREGPAP